MPFSEPIKAVAHSDATFHLLVACLSDERTRVHLTEMLGHFVVAAVAAVAALLSEIANVSCVGLALYGASAFQRGKYAALYVEDEGRFEDRRSSLSASPPP